MASGPTRVLLLLSGLTRRPLAGQHCTPNLGHVFVHQSPDFGPLHVSHTRSLMGDFSLKRFVPHTTYNFKFIYWRRQLDNMSVSRKSVSVLPSRTHGSRLSQPPPVYQRSAPLTLPRWPRCSQAAPGSSQLCLGVGGRIQRHLPHRTVVRADATDSRERMCAPWTPF